MKHALIDGTRVAQIENEPFPIAAPFFWVDVPDDTLVESAYVDGRITPPPPQMPMPVSSNISDRQFFQQLAIDGEITEAEALAAVATGTVPQALAAVIAVLPASDQFAANMFLQGATTFERNHPMTLALAALMKWDGQILDALWTKAATL